MSWRRVYLCVWCVYHSCVLVNQCVALTQSKTHHGSEVSIKVGFAECTQFVAGDKLKPLLACYCHCNLCHYWKTPPSLLLCMWHCSALSMLKQWPPVLVERRVFLFSDACLYLQTRIAHRAFRSATAQTKSSASCGPATFAMHINGAQAMRTMTRQPVIYRQIGARSTVSQTGSDNGGSSRPNIGMQ
jgi:hypothetical protein